MPCQIVVHVHPKMLCQVQCSLPNCCLVNIQELACVFYCLCCGRKLAPKFKLLMINITERFLLPTSTQFVSRSQRNILFKSVLTNNYSGNQFGIQNYQLRSQPIQTMPSKDNVRGAFIVLEGCDRSGKTTQSKMLVESLNKAGITADRMSFPDRSTRIGKLIDEYMKGDTPLPDQAIHLLFSANRWELSEQLRSKLESGCTLIVDRYAYSGVAYTTAKGLPLSWCRASDEGLPQPDVVFYLDLSPETAKTRPGFGDEKYEKTEFQAKVAEAYDELLKGEQNVQIVPASCSLAELHSDLLSRVVTVVENMQSGDDILPLWTEPSAADTNLDGRGGMTNGCKRSYSHISGDDTETTDSLDSAESN